MIYRGTEIVRLSDLAGRTTIGAQFPQQAFPINDAWLNENGFARVARADEYVVDVSTQIVISATLAIGGGIAHEHAVVAKTAAQLLADAQMQRLTLLGANYATKIATGFTYNGSVFQIDDVAEANMNAVQTKFLKGATNAHGGYWRSAADVNVAMTDAQVQAFFDAAYAYKLGAIQASHAAKDAIVAASTVSAVNAVDVSLAA